MALREAAVHLSSAVHLSGAAVGAAPTPKSALSGVTLLLVIAALFVAYGLGYSHARFRRATSDYKATKNTLSGLRKLILGTLTTTVGRLALVLVVIAVTMGWTWSTGHPPR